MERTTTTTPRWIVARLGDDMNWWVREASDEIYWPKEGLSLLDPRQFHDVLERLQTCRPYGYKPESFARAFQLFEVQSELADGELRLRPARMVEDGGEAQNLFAMPVIASEEDSRYGDFVEAVEGWRLKMLNKTHHYGNDVDALDLEGELEAKANDRYFSGSAVHCYHELSDILSWSPAEWGEAEGESEARAEAEEDEADGGATR
ncbi:MAG: hypothetical protein HZA91_09200 [Verrucomicrobia bacterium]|nr:hypothetical protein [Verrucomicrobiota bacterium]